MTNSLMLRAGTAAARLCLLLAVAALSVSCVAQAPTITTVNPPNWWMGHTVNPVRLLLRGANLSGASVAIRGAGAKASAIKVSTSGTSLFCDLTISPTAAPGPHTLYITTPQGNTSAPFDILPRLQNGGKIRGLRAGRRYLSYHARPVQRRRPIQ